MLKDWIEIDQNKKFSFENTVFTSTEAIICKPNSFYQKYIVVNMTVFHILKFTPMLFHLGTWSLQYERGSGLVCVRNLQWLGFSFYHVPNTRKFGSMYVGTGERNYDIPFML